MAGMRDGAVAKFDKDALKRCLKLADVADRWTELTGQKFSEDDLLDFGESHDLEICVRLSIARIKYTCGTPPTCNDDDILDVFAIAPTDIRLLRSESQKSVGITPGHLSIPKGFQDIAENPVLLHTRMINQMLRTPPPLASLRDCVISKIERDRFERERFTDERPQEPEVAPRRNGPGRPPHEKKIEDFLADLRADAVEIANYLQKPTVPSVIKKLMADPKWQEHGFPLSAFEKAVKARWWKKINT